MKKLLAINDLTCIFRGTQGQIEKSARARAEAHICPARRSYIRRIRIYMRSSFIISASEA